MIKYFCDICGKELSRQNQGRIKVRRGRVSVEVMTALDDGWNSGHLCHDCIIDVIVAYGERSREVYKLDASPETANPEERIEELERELEVAVTYGELVALDVLKLRHYVKALEKYLSQEEIQEAIAEANKNIAPLKLPA